MTVRTRFAPSPTGFMHLGNLRSALYTYLFARRSGGTFILRVEDTDQEREVPGGIDKIYASLKLAGLSYDEGPDVGGDYGPYIQTLRRDLYPQYAQKLIELGGAYPCFCTKEQLEQARADAEARGETYKYDKRCLRLPKDEVGRRLAAGEPHVIRQNVPLTGKASFDDVLYGHVEVDCATLDDSVLIKADGLPTYNFANVIDDHLMAITHVMRGTEYLSSTPKYNLLYQSFGWTPPTYVHMSPVMADSTRKLSKRKGDPSFEDLLDMGYLRDAIVNFVALLGWSPRGEREFYTLAELEQVFDLEGLNKAPAIFDMAKLTWFNAEYMRRLPFDEFYALALPWIEKGLSGRPIDARRVAELLHSRVEVLNRIPGMIDFLAELPAFDAQLYVNKKQKCDAGVAKAALTRLRAALAALDDYSETSLHEAVMAEVAALGMKTGQALWPLRVALSGRASTPGGAIEIAYLLGKDQSLARIDAAIEAL
ncbi:MAG: glutamate--tRNA ligase [Clostridiales bacterium]|nr:glutamate--tRNA ligase [Clostridiales bacterium]